MTQSTVCINGVLCYENVIYVALSLHELSVVLLAVEKNGTILGIFDSGFRYWL
jgi:hypothetical protein